MPLFNPPAIGGTIALGTPGSVLFVGAGGLFAQDNTNLFWDDTDNALLLAATPPASATKASLLLGGALSGGSGSGTYLGINAGSGYAGDLARWQVAGSDRLRVTNGGVLRMGSGSFSNSAALDIDGVDREYGLRFYNDNVTTSGSNWKGFYLGIGRGLGISEGYFEVAVLDESGGRTQVFTFVRGGGFQINEDIGLMTNNKSLLMQRPGGLGTVGVLRLDSGDQVIVSGAFNNTTTIPLIFRVDEPGSFMWQTEASVTLQTLTGAGVLSRQARDAATNTVTVGTTLRHNTSGTPAAGFGSELRFQLESSTTPDVDAAGVKALWATATHASRKGRGMLTVWDTSEREALRWETDGSNAMVGVLGASAIARPSSYTLAGSATRTFPTDPSSAYSGIDNAQAGSVYAALADLNILRGVVSSLEGVVRQLVTDMASTSGFGWLAAA